MLYKLLVADDEEIMINSIKFIVGKNFENISITSARTGREAIEVAEEVAPDIIFMDIKMPGINGIDAIKEIKTRNSNTKFVILSAYEQFDFAREAVKLGVNDYLTKPVTKDRIIAVINRIIGNIEQERDKRKRELDLKERFERVIPVLEHGFIYSMLFFDDSRKEFDDYKRIFEIQYDSGYIMTFEFGEKEDLGHMSNKIGLSVKSQYFYAYFRDLLKSQFSCIVGPAMLNRIIVFVPTNVDEEEYSQRLDILNRAEYLYKQLSQKIEADFCIGIGRIYKGSRYLHRSYDESIRAIKYIKDKGFIHIKDVPLEENNIIEYTYEKEKKLIDKVSCGDIQCSIKIFNEIFENLQEKNGIDIKFAKYRIIEIMVVIHRVALGYGIDSVIKSDLSNYLNEMSSMEFSSELKLWCLRRIERISGRIAETKEKKVSTLIQKARKYIVENFNKEITLEEVSREVNISPYYFSKLFKEEMGENFIEYLTMIRMQRAKQLLEEGHLSVKEICFLIGYGDPNYFSRIFKKCEGIAPTEYREKFIK